ncbi:MAG: 1-deoxy-D-xylulose-5-phosphate synthase [Ruminococcaceae bacterium]|nr:1-deoxy-D-xylulose-5-phosphate synthase [Oscillospiraceae bacterium]
MYRILESINEPADVKQLNMEELNALAGEIRSFLIETVSRTGGHLASNLGVVELTLALFKCLDMPRDGIVWDVGHQTYVHKLLTGRREQFATLRQLGGMSGFPKSSESVFDVFNTGHSSTSISAAFGMTRASELAGENARTVAVIGDGALGGGMAFEALNAAGTYQKNFIVILNDNEMSIAKNVGGMSRYLTRIRTRPLYFRMKSRLERGFRRIPVVGEPVVLALKKIKDAFRYLITSSTVFEDLGFTYLGPIDGHDLPFLCDVLEQAMQIQAPVLIHIKTKKGKGYKFAEEAPTAFHGIGAFQVETGEADAGCESYSSVFGHTLFSLACANEKICAVTAAMPDGTGLKAFAEHFPKRFFDVGIAEQHAITFAAGLSKSGLKPVVAIYSSFLQRAYDQILHDVCLQNIDLLLCVDRSGIVGEDGETHQGIYDLAYLSQMPHMAVLAPAHFAELSDMLRYALTEHTGPIAIRYPRGSMQATYRTKTTFSFQKAEWVHRGEMVCLIAAGHMLSTALEVYELLQSRGLSASVINLRTIRPLDEAAMLEAAQSHRLLVTLEDGIRRGGVGEQILAAVKDCQTQVLIKAHENGIVPHGRRELLYAACGLDAKTITQDITDQLHWEKKDE